VALLSTRRSVGYLAVERLGGRLGNDVVELSN
jgi:hypothetical protein